MSDFKVGDRVRDDRGHEGVVSTLPRVKVKFDSGGEMWLLPESCTKIEPPVKRGDPVTAENIDRLPNYTAVRVGRRVFSNYSGKWYETGNAYGYAADVMVGMGAVIIELPESS